MRLQRSNGPPWNCGREYSVRKKLYIIFEISKQVLDDEDPERKIQAEVLLNAYSRDLERRRLSAGAQGLLISQYGNSFLLKLFRNLFNYYLDDDFEDGDDADSDDEFHYPQSSHQDTSRSASRSSGSFDQFSRPGSSRVPADLTPQLTQAPDFRVPTHEKVLTPRWTSPTPHHLHAQWERDDLVSQCKDCQRRFNFLNRRVSLITCHSHRHKLISYPPISM